MKKFKAYYLLFLTSVIFFVISFLVHYKMTFDINIYDTYYVISEVDFYIMNSFFTMMIGLLYFIFEKFKIILFSVLSKVHIFGTIFLFFLIIYFNYYNLLEYQSSEFLFDKPDYNKYIIISILVLISLQLLFIINIFVSLIKKMKTFRSSK
ncbi:hypothetical protein GCM10022388_07090 [Flavobacterium chungnamense]|uniref:Uncharacterized protein n=1 Tax=Flavobacterium chungnamense TaxID=706182 RepID=A0ABP7UIL5_9FLAO